MRTIAMLMTAASLTLFTACGGGESASAGGDEAAAEEAAGGDAEKAAVDGDPEEVICCQYTETMKGTATRQKCADNDGEVLAREECP